jgi:hypothetical protein
VRVASAPGAGFARILWLRLLTASASPLAFYQAQLDVVPKGTGWSFHIVADGVERDGGMNLPAATTGEGEELARDSWAQIMFSVDSSTLSLALTSPFARTATLVSPRPLSRLELRVGAYAATGGSSAELQVDDLLCSVP